MSDPTSGIVGRRGAAPAEPGDRFTSPMEVVWDPHLDHDERIRTLEAWLARERLLYRSDRAMARVTRMRQIEQAVRTLTDLRRAEGAR